jgi:hypothetical protein
MTLNHRNSSTLCNKSISLVFAFSYAQQEGASGMIKFLVEAVCPACHVRYERAGWIRDRFERTIADLTLWMKPPVKTEIFINRPGRFFHYEPLFTSFIRLWRGLSAKI